MKIVYAATVEVPTALFTARKTYYFDIEADRELFLAHAASMFNARCIARPDVVVTSMSVALADMAREVARTDT
jgi:hypothetical protein